MENLFTKSQIGKCIRKFGKYIIKTLNRYVFGFRFRNYIYATNFFYCYKKSICTCLGVRTTLLSFRICCPFCTKRNDSRTFRFLWHHQHWCQFHYWDVLLDLFHYKFDCWNCLGQNWCKISIVNWNCCSWSGMYFVRNFEYLRWLQRKITARCRFRNGFSCMCLLGLKGLFSKETSNGNRSNTMSWNAGRFCWTVSNRPCHKKRIQLAFYLDRIRSSNHCDWDNHPLHHTEGTGTFYSSNRKNGIIISI